MKSEEYQVPALISIKEVDNVITGNGRIFADFGGITDYFRW